MIDRDALGRIVREAWVKWAKSQPDAKPSWLVPYDFLTETEKEADRQIGEAVALALEGSALKALNVRDLVDRVNEAVKDGMVGGALWRRRVLPQHEEDPEGG